jgi:hypothetical protein
MNLVKKIWKKKAIAALSSFSLEVMELNRKKKKGERNHTQSASPNKLQNNKPVSVDKVGGSRRRSEPLDFPSQTAFCCC